MTRHRFRWTLRLLLTIVTVATTVRPVDAVPLQSWDRVIPSGEKRFKVLAQFNGEAVLDKETGLVWQRSPSASSLFDWGSSGALCIGTAIGGRRGWRLPAAWELMTLKDPSQSMPALTPGHPFENIVTGTIYWTSTASLDDPANGMGLTFTSGGAGIIISAKTGDGLRWCVRGPGGDYPGTP